MRKTKNPWRGYWRYMNWGRPAEEAYNLGRSLFLLIGSTILIILSPILYPFFVPHGWEPPKAEDQEKS